MTREISNYESIKIHHQDHDIKLIDSSFTGNSLFERSFKLFELPNGMLLVRTNSPEDGIQEFKCSTLVEAYSFQDDEDNPWGNNYGWV